MRNGGGGVIVFHLNTALSVCSISKMAQKGAFTLKQKMVRTCQKIGPDPITFVKEQSTFHGAIGAYAYGPLKS